MAVVPGEVGEELSLVGVVFDDELAEFVVLSLKVEVEHLSDVDDVVVHEDFTVEFLGLECDSEAA